MAFWRDLKNDIGIAILIVLALGVFTYCAEGTAVAQTVQPVYTRPSKGTVLTTFNAPQNSTATTTVYDWSAFSSAQPTIKFAKADGTGCACPAGHSCGMLNVVVNTLGSSSKTGPFFLVDSFTAVPGVPVSGVAANDAIPLAQVNIPVPFAQFSASIGNFFDSTTSTPIATPCYMTVTVTPIPFTNRQTVEGGSYNHTVLPGTNQPVIVGGSDYVYNAVGTSTPNNIRVNDNGVLAVGGGAGIPILPTAANYGGASPFSVAASPAAATLVFEFSGSTFGARHGLRLENVGAQPVYCAAGEDSSLVSVTNYAFTLKKPAAAGDGSGGIMDIPQMNVTYANGDSAKVYCIAPVAGASSVAVMPY